ncbi:transporter [Streptomyces venezuelae]|uniref:Protein YobA n=1 Tax=Streptomyces venezuelae TaxID=54571 RepID=A0A5P2DSR0_STRVZ|nr:copper resistance protein CopC [Streptomyces venezuelae]QES58106.1 transporter [Streptomyces venezuelae]
MHTGSPTARTSPTVLARVAALLVLLALILGGAGPAFAHAGLSGSDPADGTVLKTAPKQVTLTFTESVSFSEDSLRVLTPQNERANPRPAQYADGKDNTARVELSGELPEGTYTVAWRVVSADGHPIAGAFVFSIGKPSDTAAVVATGSSDDTAAGRLYGFFRYVAYSGLALLVGAAAFVLVCWPSAGALRPVRRLLAVGWAALAVSTVALLLLRGPYETAGALTSAFDPSRLGRTVTGRSGIALIARLVLLAAAAVALRRLAVRSDHRDDGSPLPDLGARVRAGGAVLALALAFTWASAEHASAGIQVPLAIPVSVLHLLAMGVWLGGLITLLVLLRRRGSGSRALPASAIGRFSSLAFTAVAVLAGTGMYQSWRQAGSWEALSSTSYGRILAVKIAAVVLVLCVAFFSRRWTARLLHEAPPAVEPVTVPEPVPVPVPVMAVQTAGAEPAPEATDHGGTSGVPGGGEPGEGAEPPVSGADGYRRGLRRTVAVEAVLGVVVLAITTLLTGTQPSRAAGPAPTAAAPQLQVKVVTIPFDMGTAKGRGTVQITLDPGRVGENTVEAVVYTADGGLATVPELRLTLTQNDLGIGPLDADLKDQKGYWATYDLRLPMPGVWTLNVTVRTTDIDQVTVRESVRIT